MGAESGNQIKEASPPTHRSPLVHTPLAVFCIMRGLVDTYVGIPHSKAHPASPRNQQHGHAQEVGPLEQVHTSPRCRFGAIWAEGSFILGTWNMEGGGCRLWVDMSLGISEHFIPRGCYAHGQGKSSHYPDLRAVLVLLEHTWYIVNALSVGRMRERDSKRLSERETEKEKERQRDS